THNDANRPGCGESYCLVTTILNPRALPARAAALLYHERWEEELALDEIKVHLLKNQQPLLRSTTPALVIQELYGAVLAHRIVRWLMHEAADAEQEDPRRFSFLGSVQVLEDHLPETPHQELPKWYARLLRELRQQRLPPRRERCNP